MRYLFKAKCVSEAGKESGKSKVCEPASARWCEMVRDVEFMVGSCPDRPRIQTVISC